MQHALQITHRLHGGKSGLAQVHLVSIFERTQQFHAIERTQIQIGFQIRLRDRTSPAAPPFMRVINSANGLEEAPAAGIVRKLRLHHLLDHIACAASALRCAENLLRPHEPVPHALIFSQSLVRALYHRLRIAAPSRRISTAHGFGVSISRQARPRRSPSLRAAGATQLPDPRDKHSCRRESRSHLSCAL